jgi:hypothetical protein
LQENLHGQNGAISILLDQLSVILLAETAPEVGKEEKVVPGASADMDALPGSDHVCRSHDLSLSADG